MLHFDSEVKIDIAEISEQFGISADTLRYYKEMQKTLDILDYK